MINLLRVIRDIKMKTQNSKIEMPKDVYKWLEDSHIVTERGLPKLEEVEHENYKI